MKQILQKGSRVLLAMALTLITLTVPISASGTDYAAVNLALNKHATASGQFNPWIPDKAFDGVINRDAPKNEQSRWAQEPATSAWIQVDLEQVESFDEFQIAWETAAQVPSKFKIEVSSDGTNYTTAHDSQSLAGGHPLDTTVTLDAPVSGRYVKLSVEALKAGAWNSVSLYEMKVLQKYENLALQGTMSANGYEDNSANVAPAKANDGNYASRWSSSYGINEKWLQVDLGEAKAVRSVALAWERKNATEYKIQTSLNGTDWNDQVLHTASPAAYRDLMNFDAEVQARYVRVLIQNFVGEGAPEGGTSISWPTVSIYEFEVYGEELHVPEKTVSEVAASLQVPPIQSDDTVLTMPEVPNGFELSFIGADYEQLIDADRSIHHPLTDTSVKVNFQVSKGEETAISPDMTVLIPGVYPNAGTNAKPIVVPELAEWYGHTGSFTISPSSRIIVGTALSDAYMDVANEFAKDYQAITGMSIEVARGDACASGSFCFVKELDDTMMLEEGYTMKIEDGITISSIHETGAYWSTRSILQILKQTGTTIPKGLTRDYPKYKVRGFMLDVGRKPFSFAYVQDVAKNMAWYKMNDFQLHLSDNFIWIERYLAQGKDPREEAYSGFRLESDYIGPENGKALTSSDVSYQKDDFRQLIKDARTMGVNIVPEFDTPAHSLAFTRVRPDLAMQDHNVRRWADHLDLVSNYDASLSFIQGIFNEYMTGADPVFDGDTIIGIGTDEYEGNYKSQFRRYTGDLLDFVKDSGRKVRLWGSLGSSTAVGDQPRLDPSDVQMSMWSNAYASPQAMMKEGFHMINMNESSLYLVPGANYYGDYLNQQNLYNNYNAANFGGNVLPAGSPLIDGAEFALWNDYVDLFSNGISEYEVTKRIFPVMTSLSERLWGDAEDKTYAQFTEAVAKVNEAPGVNLNYEIETVDEDVINFDFNDEANALKDQSGNAYDAHVIQNAQITDVDHKTALELQGKESYIETSLSNLKPNFELNFKVKRMSDSSEEQILFESDQASIKAVQKGTGKVGYSRDFYDYSFDYILPLKEWHTLKLQSIDTSVKLYVDGVLVDEIIATGKGDADHASIENYPTLTMPLTRVGSQTNAFIGYIDDIRVSKVMSEEQLLYAQELLTADATSYYGSTGPDKALDQNRDTFWETYWGNGGVNGQEGAWPYSFTLTFKDGQEHALGKLSYLPRQDGNQNGTITGYKLFAIKQDGSETALVENGTWTAGNALKSITFPAVSAKGIRIEIIATTGAAPNTTASAAEFNLYAPETFETDKEQLQYLITQAQEKQEPSYTTDSFASLQSALEAAELVNENEDAMQAEITVAVRSLLDALDALVDVTELQSAMNAFGALQKAEYETQLYAEVEKSVNDAKALLTGGTKEAVAEAADTIFAGVKALERSRLEALISAQHEKYEENYTADSWQAYQTAIEQAQDVLDQGSAAELSALKESIVELLNKASSLALAPADKTALHTLLEACAQLQEAAYTPSTWRSMQDAYRDAEAVDQKISVTVREIRLAYEALAKANTALIERGDVGKLRELLDSYEEQQYTADSWALFVPVLSEAEALIAKGDEASKAACDEMSRRVSEAAKLLVKATTNQQLLETEIQMSEKVEEALYTTDSYHALRIAIDKAKEILNSEQGDEVYLTARDNLKAVREALILRGDTTELQARVMEIQAEKLQEFAYTIDTWSALEQVMEAAQAAIKDNSNKDQTAVNALLTALNQARAQLQERSEITDPDKTALQALLEKCNTIQEDDYLISSWQGYQIAYQKAVDAQQSNTILQEEVDVIVQNLQEAMDQLIRHGDGLALQGCVDAIHEQNPVEQDYTAESWSVFAAALQDAEAILQDIRNATQAQVDEAQQALEAAYSGLRYERQTAKLQTLMKEAEQLIEARYTASSYANVKAAYAHANEIVNDDTVKQSVIDEAYEELTTAMDKLVLRGITDALQVLVTEAQGLQKELYTQDTWTVFEQALDHAVSVLNDPDANQSHVDTAWTSLQQAKQQLKKKASTVVLEHKEAQITVTAPAGVLDPNTKLKVKQVTEQHALYGVVHKAMAEIAQSYMAYDLSLLLDGAVVQPNGMLQITMAIPESFDVHALALYYVDDQGRRTPIPFQINGHELVFETDHFSVYVLSQKKVSANTPNDKEPSNQQGSSQSNPATPSTGDTTQTNSYLFLSMMALLGMGMLTLHRRKHQKQ